MTTELTPRHGACLFVAGLMLIASSPDAIAQSPWRLEAAPFVAVGSFSRPLRSLPIDATHERQVSVDAFAVLGLQLHASFRDLPVHLSVGGSRTLRGDLRAELGSRTTSCGPTCTQTEVVYGPVGSAAVTMVWADVVISPLAWAFSPYVFAGVGHRITSYSTAAAEVGNYFDSSDQVAMRRFGLGLEVRTSGLGRLWFEGASHRSGLWFGDEREAVARDDFQSQSDVVFSAGVRLNLFGAMR